MKKLVVLVSMITVTAVTIFISCSKDDSSSSKSLKEIISSGNWYTESEESFITITKASDGSILSQDTSKAEQCDKDDYMTFKSDGTYAETLGTVKCDDESAATKGKWTLSSDEKTLAFVTTLENIGEVTINYAVTKNSDTKLTLIADQTTEHTVTTDEGSVKIKFKLQQTIVTVKK